MSAIAGIFYLNDEGVEKDQLERMIDSPNMRKRGPDWRGIWGQGPVGLAQRGFWTTDEQKLEEQPLVEEESGLTLVMDGRIDNRYELIAELKALGVKTPLVTDAEIVLNAYKIWGEDFPIKIVGDFALAIWDSRRHQLFCVRDALGVRPFYYYRGETFVAFASEPFALFEFSKIPMRPNFQAMTDYLTNRFDDSEPTEFEKVLRLRPAHQMTLKKESFQMKQYWDVNPDRFNDLNSLEDWVEAFLEVFTDSMRSRLRADGPIGITFSGGIDSSSILCLMEDLRRRGNVSSDLTAYSVAFLSPHSDETSYARSVQEYLGIKIHWLHPLPPYPIWEMPETVNDGVLVWNTMGPMLLHAPFHAAASHGKKVVFTGLAGDDFLETSPYWLLDLMKTGQVVQAYKFLKSYSRYEAVSPYQIMRFILLTLIQSSLPLGLRKLYRLIRPIKRWYWIRPPYRKELIERMRNDKSWYLVGHHFKSLAQRDSYSAIHTGYRITGLELLDKFASSAGPVELRHPFCDRRLVELVYCVPEKFLFHDWKSKGLLRTAMRSSLPLTIKERMDKSDYSPIINNLLIHTNHEPAKKLLETSYLDEWGLIDKRRARKAYEEYCERYSKNLTSPIGSDYMWQLLSLEYWTRVTFGKLKDREEVWHEREKVRV